MTDLVVVDIESEDISDLSCSFHVAQAGNTIPRTESHN